MTAHRNKTAEGAPAYPGALGDALDAVQVALVDAAEKHDVCPQCLIASLVECLARELVDAQPTHEQIQGLMTLVMGAIGVGIEATELHSVH